MPRIGFRACEIFPVNQACLSGRRLIGGLLLASAG